jgi:hypothetical protein
MRERIGGGWEEMGLAIEGDANMFDGDNVHPGAMPDVSIVYADGRYHMVYDWANHANTRGGLAYAWAARPEGPFHRAPCPIHEDTFQTPILGCYVRTYAATLIQRKYDWIIMHDMSTPGNAGGTWALACMTAARPDGPYSSPTLLLYPQADHYLPPYMEYYPAFVHAGYLYAPATSVALNRNYQCLFRAPLEQAHQPAAWEIAQHGSVWHAESNIAEAQGIWGQTFSAQVSPGGTMRVYFTSKTRDDIGTVHLAHRAWNEPFHDGFVLSAPNAAALAVLRGDVTEFTCHVKVNATGAWSLGWQCQGPLGPDTAGWNPQVHPLVRTRRMEVQLDETEWRCVSIDAQGQEHLLDHGRRETSIVAHLEVSQQTNLVMLRLNGELVSTLAIPALAGRLELCAAAGTRLQVHACEVKGDLMSSSEVLLATEALAGAGTGIHTQEWQPVQDEHFRFGTGFRNVSSVARAKWNYYGAGFKLYAPRSSAYTKARIIADGVQIGIVDLYAEQEQTSQVVCEASLPAGFHAVAIEPLNGGTIPCDCLEITQP